MQPANAKVVVMSEFASESTAKLSSQLTEVKIFHLEMTAAEQFKPSERTIPEFEIRQAQISNPAFSRFLYASVGGPWKWFERLSWTRERWLTYLDRPEQETWVGYLQGTPAGYYELEMQNGGSVEIVYFGLLPEFIGQGLGGVLLSSAVRRAWMLGAERVWVHTCTLDHTSALNNYQDRGFTVFKIEQKNVLLPDRTELLNADPSVIPVV